MVNRAFFDTLAELAKEKRLDKETLIQAVEAGLESAYKRTYLENRKVRVLLNEEKNEVEFIAYYVVVEGDPQEKSGEISVEEAQDIRPGAKVGDVISDSFTIDDFSRVAAKNVIQVIMQKINEAHKKLISEEMKGKEGELVRAVVRNVDKEKVTVEIVQTQMKGIMLTRDQIQGEVYTPGNNILVCVKKLSDTQKNEPTAYVTRANSLFVRKLLEREVPELKANLIGIRNIARTAGVRTKVVVFSNDYNVDPVYSCLGRGSERINNVSRELNDERIDIIRYSTDPKEFIANCLSPAKTIKDVSIDNDNKIARVLVGDDSYATAVGKGGSNARLASKVSDYTIKIIKNSDVMLDDGGSDNQ
ncbi:MAG: transcription termination factor NusA [Clostridia bacterium]|nr:transcription termination factor NusA [Clostridia bacterium]